MEYWTEYLVGDIYAISGPFDTMEKAKFQIGHKKHWLISSVEDEKYKVIEGSEIPEVEEGGKNAKS